MNNFSSSYNQKIAAKNNRKKDSFYKAFLLILFLFTAFFILFALVYLLSSSVIGFTTHPELSFWYFLFGNEYNPAANLFAAGFMVINTLFVTLLASIIAIPISIFTAIFIAKILPKYFSYFLFSIIAILAAIPSVIYGAFGANIINYFVVSIFNVNTGVMLNVVLTLAFMIMPTITLIAITSINSVNPKLEESASALGATKTQTSLFVTLKAAQGGIIVGILLGISRALGEATAVSMVASKTNFGPTFNVLANVRLLSSTMMERWGEGGAQSLARASSLALCTLLFIVIILVFTSIKYFEHRYSISRIETHNIKKIENQKNINLKIDNKGISNLSKTESKDYLETVIVNDYEQRILLKNFQHFESTINFGSSITSKKIRNFKKNTERKNNLFLLFFSLIGFVLLISILIFLMIGGLGALNWEYLTTKGKYTTYDAAGNLFIINGLSIPLFGTIFTMIFSLLIAIPVGVLIAIYFSIYLRTDSFIGRVFSLSIQLLTSIPSIVYGIIGSIIFLQLMRFDSLNVIALGGIFIMAIVLLPTIVKTTEQSLNDVNINQKEASFSLGATKYKTSTNVLLKQIYPQIISSAIVSMGIVLADSAIFFVLYGTAFDGQNFGSWIQNGGPTLSLEIFGLSRYGIVPWNQIKAIGLIIVFLIIILSLLTIFFKDKKFKEFSLILFGIILTLISIFLVLKILFFIAIFILIFGIIIYPLMIIFNTKYHITHLKVFLK